MIVYYSGHADAEALHLAGTHLPMTELRDLVSGSAASARVLVLDACRSGTITRVKGGTRAPAFDIDLALPVGAEGVAMLSSSAAGESSQESDALGASFFTHALVSALLGAGDTNHDGAVTLGEAFAYAKRAHARRHLAHRRRPQHPTFRLDLGGREDLVLTRPGGEHRNVGTLAFTRPGLYVVHRGSQEGPVVAELATDDGGGRIALDAGRYFVTRREPDHLEQGRFDVAVHRPRPGRARGDGAPRVRARRTQGRHHPPRRRQPLRRRRRARRGVRPRHGVAHRSGRAARSAPALARAALGFSQSGGPTSGSTSPRARSRSPSTACAPSTSARSRSTSASRPARAGSPRRSTIRLTPDRTSAGPFVGAVGQLEWPLPHRFYARVELAGLFYFLRTGDVVVDVERAHV